MKTLNFKIPVGGMPPFKKNGGMPPFKKNGGSSGERKVIPQTKLLLEQFQNIPKI
jgi:hypothetical protein